ncbi:MAG: DUF6986 family protein [Candidatus Kariarchaeaceae archaeon]|jgi:citrate lyase beta subunit
MVLQEEEITQLLKPLEGVNQDFENYYPGEKPGRKAVHTVYGGAQLFIAERAERIGKSAIAQFEAYVKNFVELAKILEIEGHEDLPEDPSKIADLQATLENTTDRKNRGWLAYTVYSKVVDKLRTEAVEDFRIDFEDGFGKRSDEEEDHYAKFAAEETAKGMELNKLPPFIGIRIKPLTESLKGRSIKTLNLYLGTLLKITDGVLPENFVITLPKVTQPEEVASLDAILSTMETRLGLSKNTLKVEIMVETPQSIINKQGESNLSKLIIPARERLVGAHFGVYDYTASVNIIAKHQEMDHLACDFARHMMKVSLAGTGIRLSDGATNILPVGPHRGDNLSKEQMAENIAVVHAAWKKGFDHTIHSLTNAFYQGWDLHPAQLPIRYAAVYSFFLSNLQNSIDRVKSFVSRAAQATLTGDVFDDAATALALLNYFNLALEAGAISDKEINETGLSRDEIYARSFDLIIENRNK